MFRCMRRSGGIEDRRRRSPAPPAAVLADAVRLHSTEPSLLRHPRLAQAVVHPLVLLVREPVLGLEVRLPCRDRLERPDGGQREVALERLARFGVMTGQGERRHKGCMRPRDVVRIARDMAKLFNRLVITLLPEIGQRLAAIPIGNPPIVGAQPNRLVERFGAFVELRTLGDGSSRHANGKGWGVTTNTPIDCFRRRWSSLCSTGSPMGAAAGAATDLALEAKTKDQAIQLR